MRPRLLKIHHNTRKKILRIINESESTGDYRLARRLRAVILNSDGRTSGEISNILKLLRPVISRWIKEYEKESIEGLYEHHSGRPSKINKKQKILLENFLDSGPVAYGLETGIWNLINIKYLIESEFGISYSPRHIRRLLDDLGFSIQRPKRKLILADPIKQNIWINQTFPSIKRRAVLNGAALIFEDEVSFRQDSTLHTTWARKGHQPIINVTGARESVKIFGCVEIFTGIFLYHQANVFNAFTYLDFLNQVVNRFFGQPIYYIQDNASYHKEKTVWRWLSQKRSFIEVFNLPA